MSPWVQLAELTRGFATVISEGCFVNAKGRINVVLVAEALGYKTLE